MKADLPFMEMALAEARKGLGNTAPNPSVGAVVVRGKRVVGTGYHKKAGGPHAEVFALREAGERAKGATIYVTLEPCSTQGRTPPCTQAILAAGIRRCVFACEDPNPAHAGAAVRILKRAGVEVDVGVCESEALELIKAFTHVQKTGKPFVSLKLAISMDGRIADARGRSKWITGPEARARVQDLRRECDAVLVGTETVRLDDPSLLPRPAHGRTPLRIIPDRSGRLPLARQVFTDRGRTLVLTGKEFPNSRRARFDRGGVQVLDVRETKSGIHWPSALSALATHGVQHVLCEGGGALAGALLKAGLVQEVQLVTGPLVLGGSARASVVGNWTMQNASQWELIGSQNYGQDVWSHYRVAT